MEGIVSCCVDGREIGEPHVFLTEKAGLPKLDLNIYSVMASPIPASFFKP